MGFVLAVDFGSTFTKLTAIDISECKIIANARAFTTIEDNVMIGYKEAFSELEKQCGSITYDKVLAASSAAGGLKMVSVGLVPDLTAKAARLAAASAGAKVMKTFAYELTIKELNEIYEINPDIILLSGGIDGGNKDIIVKNAKSLSSIDRNFSVIAAGNKSADDEISQIMEKSGKRYVLCGNVMPVFNKLDTLPAKKAIRDLFIENIITAKGLSEAQAIMSSEIIPTPLAVYNAAELLAKGCESEDGVGDLLLFDVGGATTDVCSMADGSPKKANVFLEGFAEPFAKRTVEGDIGVRYSLKHLAEEAGISAIAQSIGAEEAEISAWIDKCSENPGMVAEKNSAQSLIDDTFAAFAVQISAKRHTGRVEKTYTAVGEMFIQTGKDLTHVKNVIGTGGSVIGSNNPRSVLEKARYSVSDPFCLKPLEPNYFIDINYCFSAMGLLSAVEPKAALSIMKKGLKKL